MTTPLPIEGQAAREFVDDSSTTLGEPKRAEPSESRGTERLLPPRATMKDVASLAGVSLKTVSRVINGESGVSERLTLKVRDAAIALSFRPNLGASSLRRSDGRTATVGVILQDLANPYSAAVHRAIEDAARARGVAVLAGSIDEDIERERELVAAFASRRVDGLIVMPTGQEDAHFIREQAVGTPLVFLDRSPTAVPADVVLSANEEGARLGTGHLITHGHRAIAFLGDLPGIATKRERLDGYLAALAAANITARPELMVDGLSTVEAGEAATRELLALADPPTAILSAQNMITIGALRALRDTQAHRRVALVGFDDFPLADLLDPPVTVVAQDPYAVGQMAARRLFARVDGDSSPPHHDTLPTSLIVRGSGEIPPT